MRSDVRITASKNSSCESVQRSKPEPTPKEHVLRECDREPGKSCEQVQKSSHEKTWYMVTLERESTMGPLETYWKKLEIL